MKGRPTDDPKTLSTRIRLSQNDIDKLEYCCNRTGKKKSEIIREGIRGGSAHAERRRKG